MAFFMERFASPTYALLRIVAGLLFIWHGTQKLFAFPGGAPEGLPSWIVYTAGPIELVGGLLIMLGLLTRWAAFVCSGQMAVAYWMVHGTQGLFPLVNGGELAALYCFIFLYIAAEGPGRWSLDGVMSPKAAAGPEVGRAGP